MPVRFDHRKIVSATLTSNRATSATTQSPFASSSVFVETATVLAAVGQPNKRPPYGKRSLVSALFATVNHSTSRIVNQNMERVSACGLAAAKLVEVRWIPTG